MRNALLRQREDVEVGFLTAGGDFRWPYIRGVILRAPDYHRWPVTYANVSPCTQTRGSRLSGHVVQQLSAPCRRSPAWPQRAQVAELTNAEFIAHGLAGMFQRVDRPPFGCPHNKANFTPPPAARAEGRATNMS